MFVVMCDLHYQNIISDNRIKDWVIYEYSFNTDMTKYKTDSTLIIVINSIKPIE